MDLDGDGHLDILSGSWPGELFFFRGGSNRSFAAPIKLKYKNGKTINIGGGLRENSGEYLLVAGDAEYEQKDGKTFIVYEGERIEVPKGKQAGITGTASAVHAVDWDGDGDLDLLVGEIGGSVYLVPNEGTPKEYAFGKEIPLQAGGEALKVNGGDAGPFACDWNGDGKTDLLVGAGDGSVWYYRNTGTPQAPKLAAGVHLVPPGQSGYGNDAPTEPRRGTRAKVCAADWNGDGKLDLLVGDYTTQKPKPRELTAEQKAEHAKLRKEQTTVRQRFSELIGKLHGGEASKLKDDERAKLEKEFKQVTERYQELRDLLPPEYESHGWVWYFERQSAAKTTD